MKKVAGPPMESTVAKRQEEFRAKVQEMREGNSVAVTRNSSMEDMIQRAAATSSAGEEECAYDVINETYGYGEGMSDPDCDNPEEPALFGIVNATQEMFDLRESRGKTCYYLLPVIAKGIVIGVEIKFMGDIRREKRTMYIGTGTAFQDAEAEIQLSAEMRGPRNDCGESTGDIDEDGREGDGTADGVWGGRTADGLRRTGRRRREVTAQPETRLQVESVDMDNERSCTNGKLKVAGCNSGIGSGRAGDDGSHIVSPLKKCMKYSDAD